jgi:hypothetical protein
MTGLNLVAVQDAILAHVETSFPNYEVKEDEVLDDEYLLKIDSKVKPFIVLRWHGLNRSTTGNSFGGARWDEYNSAVDVVVVAPAPKIARRALNMIMDDLIGWVVPGGGQLIPEGGAAVFPVVDNDAKPHIYLAVNTLSFQVDSNGITP